ncbi:type 4a pilus biogenesis protein PilO [Deinococcus malanensis]|uniref:type 4a pilus biogenesis protein PilO n=1 Tax=Deinococcus malanensis TaxID=1706855 RepID=UPI00362D1813
MVHLPLPAAPAEISLLRTDLDTAQTRVTQLRSASAQLPELRKTVERLKVEQAEFVRALPNTANFGTVLDEVRRTTAATGAEMSTFSVQSGNAAGLPAGVRPIGLNLSVSGTFAELFQTLRALETMGRFTNVNTVALQLPQADSFNPSLEGTMGLTVYTFDPTGHPRRNRRYPWRPACRTGASPRQPACRRHLRRHPVTARPPVKLSREMKLLLLLLLMVALIGLWYVWTSNRSAGESAVTATESTTTSTTPPAEGGATTEGTSGETAEGGAPTAPSRSRHVQRHSAGCHPGRSSGRGSHPAISCQA